MIVGGCLCNGVRYEYDGEIEEISIYHCSLCRKAQGSAYVAVSPVDASRFRIVHGQELLREYRAVPDKARVFCANCGSPIYSARDDLPGIRRLRLGTVETPFACRNAYHIHVASQAPWEIIADGLPQYAGARSDLPANGRPMPAESGTAEAGEHRSVLSGPSLPSSIDDGAADVG